MDDGTTLIPNLQVNQQTRSKKKLLYNSIPLFHRNFSRLRTSDATCPAPLPRGLSQIKLGGLVGLNCRYHKDLELLNDSTEPSKTDYKTDPSIFSAIFRIYVCYADVFTLSKTNQKLATMQYMLFLDVCFSC